MDKFLRSKKIFTGFTIVEIIIVISIVGILATITVMSYNGWNQSAVTSQIKSDLNMILASMENARNFSDGYPTEVPSTFVSSNGLTFSGGGSPDKTSFCVEITSEKYPEITYHITNLDNQAKIGDCNLTPTNVVATASSTSSITVSWDTTPGAISYNVEMDQNPSFSGSTFTNGITTSSKLFTGLVADQTYYFRVYTVNNKGTSSPSTVVNTKTLIGSPNTPTGVIAVVDSSSQITVSWNAVSGAVSYNIELAQNPSFTSSNFTNGVTAITKAMTGLSAGQTYYLRVYATLPVLGTSDPSIAANATTTIDTPAAPVVTASTVGPTTTYSWGAASCNSGTAARYQYRHTIAPSGFDSGLVSTATTSVGLTTSVEGQTYTVATQAQCYLGAISSAWSNIGSDSYFRAVTIKTLTTIANTGGSVSTGGDYATGSIQTITATPDPLYTFTSWTGSTGCSGVASHTITMDADKSCTANFTPTPISTPTMSTVSQNTVGATTTWSWPAVSCGSNTARYQYQYTISPSGYDSGWVANGATTNIAFSTSTEGQTYTVAVQVQCYNAATTSSWSASGSASYQRTAGLPAGSWSQVSTGFGHTCAISSDGQAYCWGDNYYGQLGNNLTTDSSVPVAVNTSGVLSGKTITSIVAAENHSCAITSEGLAYCWGNNSYGQFGNGSNAYSFVPVAVNTAGVLSGKTITSITASSVSTCVTTSDGLAYCWGGNFNGVLGNNSTSHINIPVAVDTSGVLSGKTVTAIAARGNHTCAKTSDGLVYCWGSNSSGQLGNNSTTQSLVPVAVSTAGVLSGKTITSIDVGGNHTCAKTSEDLAYCWGTNSVGELGNNSTTQSLVPVAVSTAGVLSGKTITSIDAGESHTCAITSDSLAYCWGGNLNGVLGNNSVNNTSLVPVAVSTAGVLSGKSVTSIAGGSSHTCATTSDGLAHCWGSNFDGRLGNNSAALSLVPIGVNYTGVLSGKTVTSIAAEDSHTCAVTEDGRAYCWGNNYSGQLGNNDTNYTYTNIIPVAVNTAGVLSGKTLTSISAGWYYTCAISSDGLAYCWGTNGSGRLGNNSTTDSLVPVAVSTSGVLSGKTVTSIATGTAHTCVKTSAGLAYCWGDNYYGQLGNNSTTDSLVPVAVSTSGVLSGKTVTSIAAGSYHACATTSEGLAYCWGSNLNGILGNNSTTNSSVPVAVNTAGVLSGKTVTLTAAADTHTCAITSAGLAYCWGDNTYGQLGNNSTTSSLVPVAVDTSGVLSGKTITSIAAGTYHTCVKTSAGLAYCWGRNILGQLGNNSSTKSLVPVAVNTSGVLSGRTVASITTAESHSCAITDDGLSSCWGDNTNGKLGVTNPYNSPNIIAPVSVEKIAITSPKPTPISNNTVSDTTTYSWSAYSCAVGQTARYQYRYTIVPSGFDSGWVDTSLLSLSLTTSTAYQHYVLDVRGQCYDATLTSIWGNFEEGAYYRKPALFTIPTILPTSYITYTGTAPTTTTVDNIDNGVANYETTYFAAGANSAGTAFYDITNMPSDFVGIYSLNYNIRYRITPVAGDTVTLSVQIFKSDRTTPLTNSMLVRSTTATVAEITKGLTAFTGVVTSATKADWDGAVMAITTTNVRSGGADGSVCSINEVEFSGQYIK